MNSIYMDVAASQKVLPQVETKLLEVVKLYGNPSSTHDIGVAAKDEINLAKEKIRNIINCNAEEIYFTTGATMSNNLAIQGFLRANKDAVVITSAVEHEDIILMHKKFGFEIVSVDRNGFIDIDVLKVKLERHKDKPVLLSIQMANSETGVIQHMAEILKIARGYSNVYIHTDATQSIPYFSINANLFDMISMSGQKIGCIKGTGILYVKNGTPIEPIIYGNQGLIGGTENTIGIACLGVAFDCIDHSYISLMDKRNYLFDKINARIVGDTHMRLPNNAAFILDGIDGSQMVDLLSCSGIYISSGSACSNLSDEPSHVLTAMGYTPDEANSMIRLTFDNSITYEQLDYVANKINTFIKVMK